MDWYIAKDGSQVGPLTDSALTALLNSGEISADTLVWREGLADWQRLDATRPDLIGGGALPIPSPGESVAVCAVSGKVMPESDLLKYGDQWVAPENKETFLQDLREGAPERPQVPRSRGYVYRDPRLRAQLSKVFLTGFTIVGVLLTLVDAATPDSGPEEFTAADGAMAVLGVAMIVGLICSVIVFSMWTHRVVANAHAFGGAWSVITPGWAVGWYFIPFANLVKPYHALKEAWQSTHNSETVPAVMPTWWALWIITNILSNISFRLAMRGEYDFALMIDLVTVVLDIPLLISIWTIINRITKAQIVRAGV